MKKSLLLFAFLILNLIGHCEPNGYYGIKTNRQTFKFLQGESEFEINFDYSKARILNMPEEYFLEMKEVERGKKWVEHWNKELKNELRVKFIKVFNENRSIHAGYKNNPKANYIITVYILTVKEKGDTSAEIVFTRRGENKALAKVGLKAKGGKFGTLENLMGDAYKRAGLYLSKFVYKQAKIKQ